MIKNEFGCGVLKPSLPQYSPCDIITRLQRYFKTEMKSERIEST